MRKLTDKKEKQRNYKKKQKIKKFKYGRSFKNTRGITKGFSKIRRGNKKSGKEKF